MAFDKIHGDLEINHMPTANPLLAFTMGTLTNAGWDSEREPNLQSLIMTIENEVKKAKKKKEPRLIIAHARYGGSFSARGLAFGDVGKKWEKFYLYIHAASEPTIVTFHNIVVKGREDKDLPYSSRVTAAAVIWTLGLSADITVTGPKV
jgi:hypothetical protein